MNKPGSTKRPTDRDIERFLCGEADDALQTHINNWARDDVDFAAVLHERRAENAAFFVRHPQRTAPAAPSVSSWWATLVAALSAKTAWWASGVAAAVALVVVTSSGGDAVRSKGSAPTIDIVVRRDARTFALTKDTLLKANDALAINVHAQKPMHVLLALHESDSGTTTVLMNDVALVAGDNALPHSLVLDGHTGAEALWLIPVNNDDGVLQRLSVPHATAPPNTLVVPLVKGPG